MPVQVTKSAFGIFENRIITKYIISQLAGIQVCVMNYGATITNINMLDNNGTAGDIVLGFDTLDGYVNAPRVYMGSICGRFANRIANASFRINGRVYTLPKNNGQNILHGGHKGFDKVFWEAAILPANDGVVFTYTSKDGEEGFPGNLAASVTYRVHNNELHILYHATTDKATPVNLASHCYFNLSGGKENNILTHELQLYAKYFLEVDATLIPTGTLLDVKNTAMDFLQLRTTASVIDSSNEYDHCWALENKNNELVKAAHLVHKLTGREMTVYTTQPGIQLYTGNALDGSLIHTKKGIVYEKYAGLCLETQHFPDSPNKSNFPNTILFPGEIYQHQTVYRFKTLCNQ
jgi:aldose 1-epimerase